MSQARGTRCGTGIHDQVPVNSKVWAAKWLSLIKRTADKGMLTLCGCCWKREDVIRIRPWAMGPPRSTSHAMKSMLALCSCLWKLQRVRYEQGRGRWAQPTFYIACQEGHIDVARLLLEAGECGMNTTI